MNKMILKKLLISMGLMGSFFILKVDATSNISKEFLNIKKNVEYVNENKKISGFNLTPMEFVENILTNKNIFKGYEPSGSLIKNDRWEYHGLKAILCYALNEIINQYIDSKYPDYKSYIKKRNEIYSKLHYINFNAENMVTGPIIKFTEEYENASEEEKKELDNKAKEEKQKEIEIIKAKQNEMRKQEQELKKYLKENSNNVYDAIHRRIIEIKKNLTIDRSGNEEKLKLNIENMSVLKRIINIYAGCGEKSVEDALQQTKDTYNIFLIVNAFIKIINENSKYFLADNPRFSSFNNNHFNFHERFRQIFEEKKLPKKEKY